MNKEDAKDRREILWLLIIAISLCVFIVSLIMLDINKPFKYWYSPFFRSFGLTFSTLAGIFCIRILWYYNKWRFCREGAEEVHIHIKGEPHV